MCQYGENRVLVLRCYDIEVTGQPMQQGGDSRIEPVGSEPAIASALAKALAAYFESPGEVFHVRGLEPCVEGVELALSTDGQQRGMERDTEMTDVTRVGATVEKRLSKATRDSAPRSVGNVAWS